MQCFDTYYLRYKARRRRRYGAYSFLVVGTVIFAALVARSCDHQEQEALRKSQMSCIPAHKQISYREWKEQQYAEYFEKNGSKSPVRMAKAVMSTKKPKIMATIAVVETNANPHLRKYGYKKAHDGAFGVNRRYWGKVSNNPTEQALQAEFALDTFMKEHRGNFIAATSNYGGDSTDKYSRKLLAELKEAP